MKQFLTLLLFTTSLISIGQTQTNELRLEPKGFSDKDQIFVGYTRWGALVLGQSTFVIKDGVLWAFGSNSFGQLGDGTLIDKNATVRIGNSKNWKFIVSEGGRTIGLQSDGSLWVWGSRYQYTSYNGEWSYQTTPIKINWAGVWVSVSLEYKQGYGIKSDFNANV